MIFLRIKKKTKNETFVSGPLMPSPRLMLMPTMVSMVGFLIDKLQLDLFFSPGLGYHGLGYRAYGYGYPYAHHGYYYGKR